LLIDLELSDKKWTNSGLFNTKTDGNETSDQLPNVPKFEVNKA
jgi:hypothetical protein